MTLARAIIKVTDHGAPFECPACMGNLGPAAKTPTGEE